MRSFLTILSAVTLLAAGSVNSSKVTSIELDHIQGFTVANIKVDGSVRFTHQTEIAKDGRPFRIIVDILSATHNLSAKTFENLPDCRITGIRTSQFSVKPEKIVRIVLDMKGESTYRIEARNNSVFLFVHYKDSKSFATWSSDSYKEPAPAKKPAVAAKPSAAKEEPGNSSYAKIASINKALDDDRKSSLESKASKPFIYPSREESISKKPSSEASVPKVKKPSTPKKKYSSVIDDAPLKDSKSKIISKPEVKTSTPKLGAADNKPVTRKVVVKPSSLTKSTGSSVPSTQKEAIKTAKVTKKPSTAVSKAASPKPTQAKQIKSKYKGKSATESKLKKTGLPLSPNKAKAGKLAKNTNAKKSSANKKKSNKPATVAKTDKKATKSSTARFRRSPAQSRKIKGTMVAEFPKRLVIKYKGKRYRDPFETLINEPRISNSLVEKRVPNVEGLKLVGVLQTAGESNRALFEDKDGFGYILSAGDKVQKGYVLRVDMEKVYFQIFEYGWSRTVALNMDSY